MTERAERCETCKWWNSTNHDSRCDCRRGSPVFLRLHTESYGEKRPEWPETWRSDWCGEWAAKPSEPQS